MWRVYKAHICKILPQLRREDGQGETKVKMAASVFMAVALIGGAHIFGTVMGTSDIPFLIAENVGVIITVIAAVLTRMGEDV